MFHMEPLAETSEALRQLSRYGDDLLVESVARMTNEAAALVPDLVGVSLGLIAEDVVLTFVATDTRIGALDAVQYLEGGPCVRAASTGEVVQVDQLDLLDEDVWQLFALAGAAAGIKSTLSLPILEAGRVTGGVNLYGGRVGTFRHDAERLAEVFGAWLPGAVTNADLSFSTRLEAMKAPARLDEANTIEAATSVLMETHGVSWEVARQHLRESAARAGVPELSLAIIVLFERPETST